MSHAKPVDPNNPCETRVVLLATDRSQSIIGEIIDGQTNTIGYSPYGAQSAQQEVTTQLGLNGQLREACIGWYLLGNGYRAYNPRLMRFHSPDSWSPFGAGGLNPYAYCGGNPVFNKDPTGHVFLPVLDDLIQGIANGARSLGMRARGAGVSEILCSGIT
jgi:RHS repeat-associated protein